MVGCWPEEARHLANEHVEINSQPNSTMKKTLQVIALMTMGSYAAEPQHAAGTRPASSPAQAEYVLYDDFKWPNTTLDRTKWWRGGLDGVDGTNAILNESDLTSSVMFAGG